MVEIAKISGLGWSVLSVDDSGGVARDIRNDIRSFDFSTPREDQEVTGIDRSAMERLLLLADFSIKLEGIFNPTATTTSHAVFKTVPSTSVARTVTLTISAQTLANECLFTDYEIKRSDKGELTWSTEGMLADGVVPLWS